ncbi:complement C1q tumor necrosis factor-related protein 4-like [Diretmus argenteus]
MARCLPFLSLLALACLVPGSRAGPVDSPDQPLDSLAELKTLQATMKELKMERLAMNQRLEEAEKEIKAIQDVPKVAFAASLGSNGLQKTTSGNQQLIYSDVLTNVGGAYNSTSGEFTAPVRGVYYIRFTTNAPTDFPMSSVLYKNGYQIQLIAHEQPSGEGSDTASNGAALLLEKGDRLRMVLWHNTQIWDNSNHHSTFSGFLLFPMAKDGEVSSSQMDVAAELKVLQASMTQIQTNNLALKERLEATETELKALKDVPKVAFAASLGSRGLQKTTSGNQQLIYRDVLTNVGGAYNSETGEFTAPVRGVYYIRFTTNAPTDFPISSVLYKNGLQIQLIVHEQPSGEGSDTASNGAALLLEKDDRLRMVLWHNTQIWDNSNHHSTFSGFLLFPM